MYRLRYIVLMVLLSVFASCNNNEVFKEYIKFKNYEWEKDNEIIFEFNISDTSYLYDVFLSIRHTPQYPYANLQISMSIYSPKGQERTKDHDLFLRNSDGSFKGDGLGDIYDIEFKVLEKISFNEKGLYKAEISSLMPKYTTPALMDIGLIIKKAK